MMQTHPTMLQSLERRVPATNSLGMNHRFGNSADSNSPADPQAVAGAYQGLQHPIHDNDTLNGLQGGVGQGTQAPVQKAGHLSLLDIRTYDKPAEEHKHRRSSTRLQC